MDEIKKLFQVKRIFAMILAAAMVITMMPTTANAASISDGAAAQTQEADETSADTTTPDTDGSVVDESLQLDAVGETVWGFTDNRSDSDKTAVYGANPGDAGDPGNPQNFATGLSHIVITKDGSDYCTLWDDYECAQVWQKKTGTGNEDKDYTALGIGEYPTDAGEYKLVVTAPDGKTKGDFIFTITAYEPKASLELGEIKAGTAKKDVKPESFISSLYFHNGEKDYNSGHYDDNGNYVYDYEKIYFTTTLDGGTVIGRDELIPETVNIAVAQIKDAITGKVLEDTDVLTKDQDYVVDLTLTFKDNAAKIYGTNYKLPGTISKLVTISDLIVPTVVVDLGEKQQVERTYTGEAVSEPEQTKEYTVKIQLDEQETDKDGNPVTDTDKNPVYKTIPVTAENLSTSWYEGYNEDSDIVDGIKLDGAPVEAGDYTYLLTYEGQQGIYAKATAKIHVVVNAAELTIVPKFTEGAKFYPGMTVKQALAQVDYTVLDAEKKSFDAKVDRNSFWGTYTAYNTTLPYEPVFGIQVKERTEEILNEDGTSAGTVDIYGDGTGSGYGYLKAGTILQTGQTYRVVFTGQKAVYYGNGNETQKCGINEPVNSFIPSYHVADGTNGDETNEENAVAITPEAGTEAVIDSKLVQSDGKGSSYENPISKVYDGTGLFTKKAEYKIATVTVTAGGKTIAEKANPAITYTWERQDGMEPATDSEGNPITDKGGNPVMVPVWEEYDYDGSRLSKLVSPVNAGKYRLTISYADGRNNKDERGGYYAQPVEVFYEIQPQDVTIEPDAPENGYSAHAGYTVAQFFNSLYNSVELDLAGELPHKVYKLNENREPDTTEPMNWLSGIADVTTGEGVYWHPYYVEWCVVQVTDKGQVRLNDSDILENGGNYLLMADYWGFDPEEYPSYANNYKTYVDAGEDENGNPLVIYNTYGVPISLTAQGTVALDIELDTSKITTKTTKEYDGTPISILEDAKKALTVYKKDDANKTPVTDVLSDIQFVWSNDNAGKRVTETEPVDAGTYRLYAKFTGNASYKAFDSSNFCFDTGLTVTITPRELTVVPSLKEPIAAGYSNPSQYYDWSKTEFKNAAESDKEAFTYNSNTSGFIAVSSRGYRVCDADGNYVSKLKGNTEYTFEFAYMNLRGKYAANYTLKYEKVPFTTVRGYSSVVGITHKLKDSLADVKDIGTHTITANEGIEYQYGVPNDVTGENEDGNFITLRITMPEEYNNFSEAEAVYANSIEKAGGCILNKSNIENDPQDNNFIDVRFNAEDGKEKLIEFDIRWEEGYVEHFILDFSKADLLEDLRNAVAPKSISLVSPSKKMVVGGTQQLDVKLTTAQIGDLIHLTYTVDKPEVLCVTEDGKVTALAVGDATITIESTRRGENGEYVSTTPAKKTTLRVKVSEVSAPKIKKVDNILDGQARISWTPLDENDGFRREIYVLEGKTTYTKDDFDEKIDLMTNGNWEDIFAVAPQYINPKYETDSKAKLSYGWVSGLKPDTEYTVYVRNVSAVGTLECEHGNCKVAESHDGSVKGFKTTKGQVKRLSVDFDEELRYVGFNEDDSLYYYYSIALSQGTTQVAVSGCFTDWINAAGDYDWKDLPLSKDDQKDYVNPKLVYMVGELDILDYYDSEKEGYIDYSYNSDEDTYSYYYLNKTTKASIDKKGKLKLNGVGEVDVVVRDSITGCLAYNTIKITATADSIASKNVKMQVGQKIRLGDLLTYKEGKKVLIGNYARKIVVDDVLREEISKSECFELSADERYLIAVKAGRLSLTLKDAYVGEDKTATVNLTATALEPVKNLKAATVTDQYFDVEFTHSLNPDEVGYKDNLRYTEGLGFRIKITDARGTLLRSTYVEAEAEDFYNPVTKKYSFSVTGLKKKSKYNVSVTAEFGTEASKETKKPITTTLLPASYVALDKDEWGGIDVYVHSTYDLDGFYTGNSYTLEVGGTNFNPGAKAAMTDTLTWTSSNSKVATIKANTGSYSAALKAVGQGTTTIEVKSKVTKAVIARYEIEVYAVGDAYNYEFGYRDFFGEDEYLEYLDRDEIMSYALKNGMAPLLK